MTNWIPGLVTLGVGLVGGTVAFVVAKKRDHKDAGDGDVLQTRADKLIETLRELNADKHQYDEATFAAEKLRLEREAAEALRARDQQKKAPVKKPTAQMAPAGKHPTLMGALYGGAFVGFFWLLSAFIAAESKATPTGDARTEALMVLSAISISVGDHEKILQFWEGYMNQTPPRRRPPMLQKAYDWLEKAIAEE